MFVFLKLIKPFFLPPTLIAIGMAISFLLLLRKKYRWGKIFLLVTFSAYYIFSIEPTAYLLTKSLETQNVLATPVVQDSDVEAIVVLAGGATKQDDHHLFPELGGASWRRLWHGIALYRQYDGKIPLLYSGGSGDPFDPVSVEAKIAQEYAVVVGVPKENFWIDDASRTTTESGDAIQEILNDRFPDKQPHTIILVTSVRHMPRSLAVMRKRGIVALPSPADFSGGTFHITPLSFLPSEDSFASSVESIHEWVGVAGYWFLGRI